MTIKPQPLDFEGLKDEILNEFAKWYSSNFKTWKEMIEFYGTGDETEPKVVDISIKKIKQRIKSACEFYLRYKDNPELFAEEQFEKFEFKILGNFVETKNGKKIKYNEWLFKLAFQLDEHKIAKVVRHSEKGVMEDDK